MDQNRWTFVRLNPRNIIALCFFGACLVSMYLECDRICLMNAGANRS